MKSRLVMRAARLVFLALFAFAGCGGYYNAEKMFWHLSRNYGEVLRNPATASEKDFKKAVEGLRGIIARYPAWERSVQLQFSLAEIFVLRRDFANAEKEFSRVIMNFPEKTEMCARAQFSLGILCEKQGDEENAMAAYALVAEKYPSSSLGLQIPLHLAVYYQRKGMKDRAERAFSKALRDYQNIIDANPYGKTVPMAHGLMVSAWLSMGKPLEAVALLQKFVDRHPKSEGAPAALFEIARLYRDVFKQPDTAITFYERVISEYPRSTTGRNAQLEIGNFYALAGDSEKAEEELGRVNERFSEDSPMRAAAQLALAVSHDKAGRWETALEKYHKIMREYPDTSIALQAPLIIADHYVRGNHAAEAERAFEDAIEHCRKVMRKNEGRKIAIEAQEIIAAAYLLQGRGGEAIKTLALLRKNHPADERAPLALFKTALICEKEPGAAQQAAATYQNFINEYPFHTLASAARARLEKIRTPER